MGLLDKLRAQATEVAGQVVEKTQETARVGPLQLQLRTLRGEEKDALADFGREAYRLHSEGGLAEGSSELTAAAARIADERARIAEKEQEIAEARGEPASTPEGTVEVDPSTVSEVQPDEPAAAGAGETSFGQRADQPGAATAAGDEATGTDDTSFGQRSTPGPSGS
jgi:hypothetical protein